MESGLINEEDFKLAEEESERSGFSIQDVLIGNEKITEDYLAELLAPYYGTSIINLKKENIDHAILELIPETYAKSRNVIIFDLDKEREVVKLAMLDPFDYETIEYLRAKFNFWVEPYLATRSTIKYGFKQYKQKINMGFDQIISENIEQSLLIADDKDLSKTAEAVPIITILDNIIEQAVTLGSSDIHFEPFEHELLVRLG